MKEEFYRSVVKIAVPVACQSLLQSLLGAVDQLMIGQMGGTGIAGVGLGGKFASLYQVLLGAVATAAGIMIAQYMGQKNEEEVSRSFFANLGIAAALAALFFLLCICFPETIMGFYTRDADTKELACEYLKILSVSFLPLAVLNLTSVLLRCMEAAALPLYAGIAAVLANTGLNYLLIFGKWGFPAMGVRGAALATVLSQTAACVLTIGLFFRHYRRQALRLTFCWRFDGDGRRRYLTILLPLLICEFLWSLGENTYAAIYGNMGTAECAAMTLTYPVQGLLIGVLSGLSQAAGILIGKSLGEGAYERARRESKKLMLLGAAGSILLSVLLILCTNIYAGMYPVDRKVRELTKQLLFVYALVAPVKVQNMILGGGILRSGGKTGYIMWIDFIGTWFMGVPLGAAAAFLWKLPVPWVYFLLSLEECLRLGISLAVFRKGIWQNRLTGAAFRK